MLKPKVLKALNDQVNAEFYSAYLYLSMSTFADNTGFKGSSNWLWHQAMEEMSHGTKLVRYIMDKGGKAEFADVKASKFQFKSLKEVFAKVAEHERHVTDLVSALADLAVKERDHATYNMLLWFVAEQVEEVSAADDILNKFNMMGDNPAAIYALDTTLGQRGS